jgi:ribosome-binding protein aMBF1 (putative translation factor)
MGDLQRYIDKRKKEDADFVQEFDIGYETFKIGEMLKQARVEAGLTQEDLAMKLKTKKSAISRIENHAKDIKLSTLENFAHSIGKELKVSLA